jgi:hypothetical protein
VTNEAFEQERSSAWQAVREKYMNENIEQENFGHAAELDRAGYEQMQSAWPVKEADAEPIEGGREELSKAASEIVEKRDRAQRDYEGRPVDVERSYLRIGGDKSGEPMPANQVVSPEQAASDLARARRDDAEIEQTLLDQQIANAIDQLRQDVQPPQQQPEAAPDVPTVQPEINQAAASDVDPDVQRALSNPKVLAAVQQHVQQHEASAKVAFDAAMQFIQDNGRLAMAAIFAEPELQNLTFDQLPLALAAIARENPQRAAELQVRISHLAAVADQGLKTQQYQHAQQQYAATQQFQHAARQHDDAFDRWSVTQESPERVKEISSYARNMLKAAGLSEADIQAHWESNPLLRSAGGQQILFDAARFRMAQAGARDKVQKPVPTVQRPGSPLARGSDDDYSMQKLNAKLDRSTGREALRAAADLVTARRARR